MASPPRQVTFSEKLRYSFDKSMAAGPIALIGWLAVISITFICIAAVVLTLAGIKPEGEENLSFFEAAWQSLMRTLDSGTMGGDAGWGFRIIMLMVTLGGIFIVSSLIGVLTSGLESKMDELRKGRSFVIESDHTLILGWSSTVFTIISELVLANENQKAPRIVILADKDKVEMEEEIHSKVGATGARASSVAPAARLISTISKSSIRTRPNPSSSCRPKTKTPIRRSSNPFWPSPTTRTAAKSRITSWPKSAMPKTWKPRTWSGATKRRSCNPTNSSRASRCRRAGNRA